MLLFLMQNVTTTIIEATVVVAEVGAVAIFAVAAGVTTIFAAEAAVMVEEEAPMGVTHSNEVMKKTHLTMALKRFSNKNPQKTRLPGRSARALIPS